VSVGGKGLLFWYKKSRPVGQRSQGSLQRRIEWMGQVQSTKNSSRSVITGKKFAAARTLGPLTYRSAFSQTLPTASLRAKPMTVRNRVTGERLKISSEFLVSFYCFEQGLEVSGAESLRALTLNNFKEECRSILNWFCKNL